MHSKAEQFRKVEDWLRLCRVTVDKVTNREDDLAAQLLRTQSEWSSNTSQYIQERLEQSLRTGSDGSISISEVPSHTILSPQKKSTRSVASQASQLDSEREAIKWQLRPRRAVAQNLNPK